MAFHASVTQANMSSFVTRLANASTQLLGMRSDEMELCGLSVGEPTSFGSERTLVRLVCAPRKARQTKRTPMLRSPLEIRKSPFYVTDVDDSQKRHFKPEPVVTKNLRRRMRRGGRGIPCVRTHQGRQ